MKWLKVWMFLASIFFSFGLASSLTEDAQKIAHRIAQLKEKTHRALTAAKDVAPLIKRVDDDLVTLERQKKLLFDQKKNLEEHKRALQTALNQRKELLSILQTERATIDRAWERQSAQLDAFIAQKSIQTEVEVVAQTPSRDTLLARVFDLTSSSTTSSVVLAFYHQGLSEDVRG